MAYTGDTALGTPAARPLATPVPADEQRKMAESTLRQAVRQALGSDQGVTLRALPGMPGRVLVQVAQTVDADLMVLAARREHTPSRLLGPVSQHVLRNAPCPVLVVPEPGKEP
jgi:nucleotide-binding universal stress UspA family protein